MKISLHTDNTVPVALATLCELLGRGCDAVQFVAGRQLHLTTPAIKCPATHKSVAASVRGETADCDLVIVCTAVRYENNFFFDSDGRVVIISFAGWQLLTRLPISNGIGYFVASIIADVAGIGSTHDENTGCLNDFWWDKRGVDVGMRAAFLCPRCTESFDGDPRVLSCVRRVLDIVSTASRLDQDILTTNTPAATADDFDVFLSYNRQDNNAVRDINRQLKDAGIRTWFDEDQLPLGTPWQDELEKHIANVRAACVFVGESGLGPWQSSEVRGFLSEFVDRRCPVIPVLLPGSSTFPELPRFLKQMTWLDLRQEFDQGMKRLVEALRRQAITNS
jgi:nucleotide-binding universal stress UspA family protein